VKHLAVFLARMLPCVLVLVACSDPANDPVLRELRGLRAEMAGPSPDSVATVETALQPLAGALRTMLDEQQALRQRQARLTDEMTRFTEFLERPAGDAGRDPDTAADLAELRQRLRDLEGELAEKDAAHREVEELLRQALESTSLQLEAFLRQVEALERTPPKPGEDVKQGGVGSLVALLREDTRAQWVLSVGALLILWFSARLWRSRSGGPRAMDPSIPSQELFGPEPGAPAEWPAESKEGWGEGNAAARDAEDDLFDFDGAGAEVPGAPDPDVARWPAEDPSHGDVDPAADLDFDFQPGRERAPRRATPDAPVRAEEAEPLSLDDPLPMVAAGFAVPDAGEEGDERSDADDVFEREFADALADLTVIREAAGSTAPLRPTLVRVDEPTCAAGEEDAPAEEDPEVARLQVPGTDRGDATHQLREAVSQEPWVVQEPPPEVVVGDGVLEATLRFLPETPIAERGRILACARRALS